MTKLSVEFVTQSLEGIFRKLTTWILISASMPVEPPNYRKKGTEHRGNVRNSPSSH